MNKFDIIKLKDFRKELMELMSTIDSERNLVIRLQSILNKNLSFIVYFIGYAEENSIPYYGDFNFDMDTNTLGTEIINAINSILNVVEEGNKHG